MQTIYLDISNKGVVPTIYAKQGDVGRKFLAVFTDGSIPYSFPVGHSLSVWYDGDSGKGNYTHIGEKSAFSVDGNKVVVEMITQMLSVPGEGNMCLVLNYGENQMASWNIDYVVELVPGAESEGANQYYTAFSQDVNRAVAAAEEAQEAAESFTTDTSLSVDGRPADAAATGLALDGKMPATESPQHPGCYYRTVSGVTEWLNPPMILGVEYRTTERCNDRVVYTKAIECGALGKNTADDINHNTTNIEVVWVSGGYWNDDSTRFSVPYFGGGDDNQIMASAYGSIIHRVHKGYAYNVLDMTVEIKYTKSTD